MRPAKISDIHPNHESATVSLMSNKLLIEPIPSLTDNDLQAQTPSALLSYCKAIELSPSIAPNADFSDFSLTLWPS